jgi:hypothetical protein
MPLFRRDGILVVELRVAVFLPFKRGYAVKGPRLEPDLELRNALVEEEADEGGMPALRHLSYFWADGLASGLDSAGRPNPLLKGRWKEEASTAEPSLLRKRGMAVREAGSGVSMKCAAN